jgi:hypothetical protein
MFDSKEINTLLSLVIREIQNTEATGERVMYLEILETISEKLKGLTV